MRLAPRPWNHRRDSVSQAVRRCWVIALVAGVACTSGRGGSSQVAGRVSTLRGGTVLVEFGTWWTTHRSTERIAPVRSDGGFTIPSWAHAVTVFADIDGDGRLDGRDEPSSPCFLTPIGWACTLRDRSLRVGRIDNLDMAAPAEGQTAVNYVVALDAFTAGGRRGPDGLCRADREACAARGMDPFGGPGDPSVAFSPCQVKELADGKPLAIEHESPERRESVKVQPVRALLDGGDATFRRVGGVDELKVRLARPADRIFAWLGDEQATRIDWSTEEDPAALEVRGGEITLHFGPEARRACEVAPCKVMLQVLRYERSTSSDEMVRSAEVRFTMPIEAS